MGMLYTESIDYIKQQFDDKDMVLDGAGERVSPWEFYEDVFGDLDIEVPIVIIDEDNADKKIQSMTVESAITFSSCRNDVLLGGCTYFNNWISKKSARDVYALIIDLDNVYSGTLMNALQSNWENVNGEPMAKPTYIVNSGTGLHLYFVLDSPVPIYAEARKNLDNLYRKLAFEQSKQPYVKRDTLWFGQDFRMAGGKNKYNWENSVYRVGDKWDIDELAKTVGYNLHFVRYGEQKKKSEAKAKRAYKKRRGWRSNRGFYDYALKTCKERTKEGNRYLSMCALTVIAYKCNVSFDELENDLYDLLKIYNKDCFDVVKEKEVESALKMYNEKAMEAPRSSLEEWQGWKYTGPVRNHRERKEHLHAEYWIDEETGRPKANTCKQNRELALKFMRDNGEIKGRPSAEQLVNEWRELHPAGSKAECIRDLKLSKPTVYKWWD